MAACSSCGDHRVVEDVIRGIVVCRTCSGADSILKGLTATGRRAAVADIGGRSTAVISKRAAPPTRPTAQRPTRTIGVTGKGLPVSKFATPVDIATRLAKSDSDPTVRERMAQFAAYLTEVNAEIGVFAARVASGETLSNDERDRVAFLQSERDELSAVVGAINAYRALHDTPPETSE